MVVMYYNYRGEESMWIDVFVWFALGVTLVSGIDYFIRLRRLINEPDTRAA